MHIEKAFNRVLSKALKGMKRKKGLPEVVMRALFRIRERRRTLEWDQSYRKNLKWQLVCIRDLCCRSCVFKF